MEVLRHTKETYPGTEVLVITALDKVDPAVRAIKSGAAEYLVKPVAPEALQHALSRALTSRQLLRENASLRQYVLLLETGQRIATTLEKDRLIQTSLSALTQVTGASAVMLYLRSGSNGHGEFTLQGSEGLRPEDEPALRAFFDARLKTGTPDAGEYEKLPGFENALVFPAEDSNATWGLVVLLFSGSVPEPAASHATYLSRHLGLALHNVGRFAEVEDLAYLDDLTHLFNSRYLHLVLDREIKSAQQINQAFSLLFLDLDYFKSVNDTHGHLVGSKLLVEVARIVKGCVRDNDVVVRYGGDEYVVLLRSTDSGGALKVGERIRRSIETHHFLAREGFSLAVTTCIGVASFPEHASDKQSLVDMADRAMYRGKKGTRNVIYMAAKGLEATPAARHSAVAS
jgi:two-component system cell cycle response regulator